MGRILSAKRVDEGILFEIEVPHLEAVKLRGHYDDVYLFSDRVVEFKTSLASRGSDSRTRYFLVPRHLRKDMVQDYPVSCQKIELIDKNIFIYVVDKRGYVA